MEGDILHFVPFLMSLAVHFSLEGGTMWMHGNRRYGTKSRSTI